MPGLTAGFLQQLYFAGGHRAIDRLAHVVLRSCDLTMSLKTDPSKSHPSTLVHEWIELPGFSGTMQQELGE